MITSEDLAKANENLATVDIKGKDYVMVNKRVSAFRQICPSGSITTEIISLENGVVTMKATVTDDEGKVLATGLAQEKETNGYINKTSFIENCETSCIGRALGFVGIGIDESMASAEEVANAILNQNNTAKKESIKISARMIEAIRDACKEANIGEEVFLSRHNVKALSELTIEQFEAKKPGKYSIKEWVENANKGKTA